MEREHDLDSQPSELESQEEPQDDQDSRLDTDFGPAPDSVDTEIDRDTELRIDSQPNTADTEDRDVSDKEEPEMDRYGDTEADIEDAEDDAEPDIDNSPPVPSPAVISPIGEPPPSPDRCSSNSDEPPPMLTAELPTESLNTSVFNFTEDEEPPPPLHMSMNGSPRKIKMPR